MGVTAPGVVAARFPAPTVIVASVEACVKIVSWIRYMIADKRTASSPVCPWLRFCIWWTLRLPTFLFAMLWTIPASRFLTLVSCTAGPTLFSTLRLDPASTCSNVSKRVNRQSVLHTVPVRKRLRTNAFSSFVHSIIAIFRQKVMERIRKDE
jgi:hypothetical protein